jgi:DNA-binding CsgD family transcriptional regulator
MTSLAAERENVIVLPAQTPFTELVAAARGERPLSSAGLELAEGQLTEREFQTLCLLVQGLNAKEMAAHLHLSIHTIRFHIKTLLAKLGVGTQTEAILVGIERGFVRPPAARRS